MNRRALLSVSDKTGLEGIARALAERGFELVASGGTARALAGAGLHVIAVEAITGTPAMLGGRVKTLHPAVHAGILCDRSEAQRAELSRQGIGAIDVVVCNLYPFERTVAADADFAEAIEQIDIGGVTLLRAAAKNCAHVTVLCDPDDYGAIAHLDADDAPARRRRLAAKAFAHTRAYDTAIAAWFEKQTTDATDAIDDTDAINPALPEVIQLTAERVETLRYGENPHQHAALYRWQGQPLPFECLQGKTLSYNNLVDLDGAWDAITPFSEPAVALIKHTNPCGLAIGADAIEAFHKAFASDEVSAFGSILAVNREVDRALLDAIGKLYVEIIAAPAFTPDALDQLARKKKNCRAVRIDLTATRPRALRTLRGALLAQTPDELDARPADWRTVTRAAADPALLADLVFAWRAVKAVKSNAIVIARDGATLGVGAGQMNRVLSVRLAAAQAGDRARGAVLASDAFFPFADGLEAAAAAGVVAVVQPGGSMRDDEVIAAADRLGVAMLFTGVRHFKH
ncbi:MAG: bifunctional phosphoribosylaminoimidazolecarboxamide formyltransferase/IMP cyclohydrolase [Myxococcales bacterium]|nr:bifunctional phosphoribosylaminoimidazolecarboxamide formyltransferase/IMP cyclohydrolase [Myxococcales bacterium]